MDTVTGYLLKSPECYDKYSSTWTSSWSIQASFLSYFILKASLNVTELDLSYKQILHSRLAVTVKKTAIVIDNPNFIKISFILDMWK